VGLSGAGSILQVFGNGIVLQPLLKLVAGLFHEPDVAAIVAVVAVLQPECHCQDVTLAPNLCEGFPSIATNKVILVGQKQHDEAGVTFAPNPLNKLHGGAADEFTRVREVLNREVQERLSVNRDCANKIVDICNESWTRFGVGCDFEAGGQELLLNCPFFEGFPLRVNKPRLSSWMNKVSDHLHRRDRII
jgi:hypothetical protein